MDHAHPEERDEQRHAEGRTLGSTVEILYGVLGAERVKKAGGVQTGVSMLILEVLSETVLMAVVTRAAERLVALQGALTSHRLMRCALAIVLASRPRI